jgi:hypothetical protein
MPKDGVRLVGEDSTHRRLITVPSGFPTAFVDLPPEMVSLKAVICPTPRPSPVQTELPGRALIEISGSDRGGLVAVCVAGLASV